MRLLVVLLVAALTRSGAVAAASPRDEPGKDGDEEPSSPDRIRHVLDQRIEGKASLDDVRVDVFWSRDGKVTRTKVFGNGIGIWQGRLQFGISRSQVLAILRALQKSRFGSMPDRLGRTKPGKPTRAPA